ncbi:MAG: hypothetical protein E7595_01005 [Ruminococcaceae bacterium]|nr:hypothetical protein [Oscillospiraceae bacterium]
MKKALIFLLLTCLVASLAACGGGESESSSKAEAVSSESPAESSAVSEPEVSESPNYTSEVREALKLIEEGNYVDAYKLLYDQKSNDDAKKLLEDFIWVYEKEDFVSSYSYFYPYSAEYIYDENGTLIKKVCNNLILDSVLNVVTEYTYNNGRLIKETQVSTPENPDVPQSTETIDYFYDEAGRLVKSVHTNFQGGIETRHYTYNENGDLIKEIRTHTDNDATYNAEYTYDKNGDLIEEVYTDFSGTTVINNYSYARKGLLVKVVCSESEDGSHTMKKLYEIEKIYDANDMLFVEITKYPDGDTSDSKYTYDENGNLIKLVYTDDNRDTRTYEYSEYKLFYNPKK